MTSVALSFLPCRCAGKECEPKAEEEKLTVNVSEEMNVEAVRRALAAQLKPVASGFGPWRKTQVARAENVHLFMKQDGAEGELVAVTGTELAAEKFEIAHLMSKGSNNGEEHGKEEPEGDAQRASTRWYYTVEGAYGDDSALLFCAICAAVAACVACCCAASASSERRNQSKPTYQNPPLPQQSANPSYQYNYYNNPYPPQSSQPVPYQPTPQYYNGGNAAQGYVPGVGYGAPPSCAEGGTSNDHGGAQQGYYYQQNPSPGYYNSSSSEGNANYAL